MNFSTAGGVRRGRERPAWLVGLVELFFMSKERGGKCSLRTFSPRAEFCFKDWKNNRYENQTNSDVNHGINFLLFPM